MSGLNFEEDDVKKLFMQEIKEMKCEHYDLKYCTLQTHVNLISKSTISIRGEDKLQAHICKKIKMTVLIKYETIRK